VAEGVETATQLDQLRALECEQAQGYLFSMPLGGEAAAELIRGEGRGCLVWSSRRVATRSPSEDTVGPR